MKQTEQDFIHSLKFLQKVTPDNDFRLRMERKVRAYSPAGRFAMPFFALRVAVIVFFVLIGGTGMVASAQTSQPGHILYPVKQLVDSVKTSFTADKYISKAPETPLQKIKEQTPTATPTPLSPTVTPTPVPQKQTLPASDVRQPTLQPTATAAPTPTPRPQGGIGQTVKSAVHEVVNTGPVNVQLGTSSDPTPTPQPKHEGSKDNGSNAGAGGSLLPKIKIKL